jgi:spermidine synthase
VKPWTLVAEAPGPDGGKLTLVRRDGELVVKIDGSALMSSRTHGSEAAMAEAGLPEPRRARAVLVGGLGCGYTLRAVLDRVGPKTRVVVAEIAQAIIDWNRGPLAELARRPLDDRRVVVERADVGEVLRAGRGGYDAILLDVDNGPQALTARDNRRLYASDGLAATARALAAGGTLVVWSAAPDTRFATRLRQAGFEVEVRTVAARENGRGGKHVLFVAKAPRPR